MYTLKVMLTAIVTVIATLSFLFIIYNSHLVVASAQGQPLDCSAVATKLGGKAIPNGDVCDVSVIRTWPQITGPNGTIFNKFLVANQILLEIIILPIHHQLLLLLLLIRQSLSWVNLHYLNHS
jgi:hypothetical protein